MMYMYTHITWTAIGNSISFIQILSPWLWLSQRQGQIQFGINIWINHIRIQRLSTGTKTIAIWNERGDWIKYISMGDTVELIYAIEIDKWLIIYPSTLNTIWMTIYEFSLVSTIYKTSIFILCPKWCLNNSKNLEIARNRIHNNRPCFISLVMQSICTEFLTSQKKPYIFHID